MTEALLDTERRRFEELRFRALQRQADAQGLGSPPISEEDQRTQEFRAPPPRPRAVDRYGVTTALQVGPAVLGGVAGAPGGPLPMIAGGALGTAAGYHLANLARDAEDLLRTGKVQERGFAEEMLKGMQAGGEDLLTGTALYGVGRIPSQAVKFLGRITGAQSPEVATAIREAAHAGVPIGAVDLNKPFYNISARVTGVLPIVGAPTRTAAEVKTAQISQELVNVLDDVSPAIDLNKLGVRMTDAAKSAVKARRDLANERYRLMYQHFDAMGNPKIIPTDAIRARAGALLGDLKALPKTKKGGFIEIPVGEEGFTKALQSFTELADYVTPRELEALQKNLNKAARMRSGDAMRAGEYHAINELNAASWDAMDGVTRELVAKRMGRQLRQVTQKELDTLASDEFQTMLYLTKAAKRSWKDLKALEETSAAMPFKKVDRNFFAAGFEKPGAAQIDELADMYVAHGSTLRSPTFLRDLETLIGPENRKALARAVLQRTAAPEAGLVKVSDPIQHTRRMFVPIGQGAGKGTTEVVLFDAAAMKKRLGLADPEHILGEQAVRQNRNALAKLVDGTGLSVARLESFLNTAERIQQSPTGDPSIFLTRRLVLSGTPKALIPGATAAGGAAEASGGLISLGTFTVTGRAFSRLISTPQGLELLREGMKPKLSRQQLMMLGIRLSRMFPFEKVEMTTPDGTEEINAPSTPTM